MGPIYALLKVELRPQFHQPSAHDLDHVSPRVILRLVPCLLVQDGVVVENVVHVEVPLQLHRVAEPEDSAETNIELFDPLSIEYVVGDQVDRGSLRAGGGALAWASRQMPAQ